MNYSAVRDVMCATTAAAVAAATAHFIENNFMSTLARPIHDTRDVRQESVRSAKRRCARARVYEPKSRLGLSLSLSLAVLAACFIKPEKLFIKFARTPAPPLVRVHALIFLPRALAHRRPAVRVEPEVREQQQVAAVRSSSSSSSR